jgi:hypothetical protein
VASRKKKSNIQKVAALATAGLPAPVQQVASTKIGSLLLIAGAVIAVATGAITVSWKGGMPSVTVNEARAEELKQRVQAEARIAVERIAEERGLGGVR